MNNTMNPIPKMMTIAQIAKTGLLPENALRVMLKEGVIKAIYSGKKAFVNYDNLCEYLRGIGAVTPGGGNDVG